MPSSSETWVFSTPGSAITDNGYDLWLVDTVAGNVTLTFDSANFPAHWRFTVKHARTTGLLRTVTIQLTGGALFNNVTNTIVLGPGRSVDIDRITNPAGTGLSWESIMDSGGLLGL